MSVDLFFTTLASHAASASGPALVGHAQQWTYDALLGEVERRSRLLIAADVSVLATLLDNGADWVFWDLAALRSGVRHLPLAGFFSPEQIQAALLAGCVDAVAVGAAGRPLIAASGFREQDGLMRRQQTDPRQPMPCVAKVTFTSGSTAAPKGVCLSARAMLDVAQGLCQALADVPVVIHLNALPFAVLLENVAGLYAPLWRGATCVSLPSAQVGLSGSSSFEPSLLDRMLREHSASSVILLPQMLRQYTRWLASSHRTAPATLKFAAVGGAAVGASMIEAAWQQGIPAYEGYGLSEGASVQTLNVPGLHQPGSVGRVLPHCQLRISDDGEILVRGSLFDGYLGQPTCPSGDWYATGDLGYLDANRFLYLQGRKRYVLITAFGRNVSPEWVETALQSQNTIAQAVVVGDGLPALGAVIWPSAAHVTDT